MGFYASLCQPANRKLDEFTLKGFKKNFEEISQYNLPIFIDPIISDGRHMFARSPFRK